MTDNSSNQPSRRIRFGPYEVDLHTHELWKHGTRIKMAGQPFAVLAKLLSRPGDLVTREELQQELWSEDTFADFNHGLNAAVNKLRETLHDTASNPKYIETLPRRGYRFIGAAETAPSSHAALPETQIPNRALPLPPMVSSQPAPRDWTNSQAWSTAAAVLLVAFGVITLFSRNHDATRVPQAQDAPIILADASRQPAAAQIAEVATKVNQPRELKSPTHKDQTAPPPVFREAGVSEPVTMRTIISGEGGNAAPQFSPDGRRIAFMSDRSGPWQIWVSKVDGSDPVQLSHTDSAGTPRWSPDGRLIAFDAPSDEGTSVYVISSDGRARAICLTQGQVPSFSRDGRWIYFGSDRLGDMQVWRIPVNGGVAEQVTKNGGFAALESNDGYLYYTKSPRAGPEICRKAVNGGDENCTLPHVRPRTWSSWAVTRNGILFAEDMPGGMAALSVYEPTKRQVRDLVWLPSPPVWMGASADGREAIVNDVAERRISVVGNLR